MGVRKRQIRGREFTLNGLGADPSASLIIFLVIDHGESCSCEGNGPTSLRLYRFFQFRSA
jgi:hypothetical protein